MTSIKKDMYCNTVHDWSVFKQRLQKYTYKNNEMLKDDCSKDVILNINIRFVNIYEKENERVSESRINDNLLVLNNVFGGKNTEELLKVPDTPRHPWKQLIGNPNIQFQKYEAIQYIKTDHDIPGSTAVDYLANNYKVIDGVINVFISDAKTLKSVGQAKIFGNVIYMNYQVVGGNVYPGTIKGYSYGKTLVHEVGHILGLYHPFSDEDCDNVIAQENTQLPEAIRPNYDVELFQNDQGEWDQRYDNRDLDRINNTKRSCLHIQKDTDNSVGEMGINIMDYAPDNESIMFTQGQVDIMRGYLQSSDSILNLSESMVQNNETSERSDYFNYYLIILFSVQFILLVLLVWYLRTH